MDLAITIQKTNKEVVIAVLFAVIIILFYGNSIQNGFVQDDVQVEKNPYLQSLNNIPKAITSCSLEYINRGCEGRVLYYRPFPYFTYFLLYQISPNPWIFHLANLAYLFFAVFLVFLLSKAITSNIILSFISTLIFLIHPINSESVNWISAASEILYTIFVILGTLYYLKYCKKGSVKNLVLVYFFYFFALLSKETAIFFPIIILAIDVLYYDFKIKSIFEFKKTKKYLMFAIPFIIYYIARVSVIGSVKYFGGFSFPERIYAAVVLFAKHLSKLFYPFPLQITYDFKTSSNLFSSSFIISAIACLLFVGFFIYNLKKKNKNIIFALIWFLVFLVPTIFFLQGAAAGLGFFFERYLFAPSVGFCLIVGYFLYNFLESRKFLSNKSYKSYLLLFLVFTLLGSLGYASYKRNQDWKSDEILLKKTLFQIPQASNLRYQLAFIYLERGDLEEAKTQFEGSINKNPEWKDVTMAYKGLGDYYKVKGDLDNALISYQKAVETAAPSPRDFITFNDLGTVYMDKGNYLKGLIYFCQSLVLLPGTETVTNNFDTAASLVDSDYIQKNILYDKLLEEFKLFPEQRVRYIGKNCTVKTCQYSFSVNTERMDVMLPFLLSAASGKEEARIGSPTFEQQQGIVRLEIDKKFSSKDLVFLFPACSGYYDKVEVKPIN